MFLFYFLVFVEHREIIILNAKLFGFKSEFAQKTMNEGLIIGGLTNEFVYLKSVY